MSSAMVSLTVTALSAAAGYVLYRWRSDRDRPPTGAGSFAARRRQLQAKRDARFGEIKPRTLAKDALALDPQAEHTHAWVMPPATQEDPPGEAITTGMIRIKHTVDAPPPKVEGGIFPAPYGAYFSPVVGEKIVEETAFYAPLHQSGQLCLTQMRMIAVYYKTAWSLLPPKYRVKPSRHFVPLNRIRNVELRRSGTPDWFMAAVLLAPLFLASRAPLGSVILLAGSAAAYFVTRFDQLSVTYRMDEKDSEITRHYALKPRSRDHLEKWVRLLRR